VCIYFVYLCVSIRVYSCVFICVCVCIYLCLFICVYLFVYLCIFICANLFVCIYCVYLFCAGFVIGHYTVEQTG